MYRYMYMFLNTRKPEMEYFEKKKMFCSKVKILFLKKNAQNFLKQNNMEKYFVTFLQGYPLKTQN